MDRRLSIFRYWEDIAVVVFYRRLIACCCSTECLFRMGCVQTSSLRSQEDNAVKTLYLHRKLTRKSRRQNPGGQTGEGQASQASPETHSRDPIPRNYSCASLLSLEFTLEGKEFSKFPRWRGYKMCNVCDKDDEIDIVRTMETAKHKLCNRCMMITEIRNSMNSCVSSKVSATAFANLLALVW